MAPAEQRKSPTGKPVTPTRSNNPEGQSQSKAPSPRSRHEVADKYCRDDDRARAEHSDRLGNQKLPLVEPVKLLDQPLLQKRHDNETATESERSRFEKEQKEHLQC